MREKMKILLDQIKLPAEMRKYFSSAELQKVIVLREEKRWLFHIKLRESLPFNVFYTFKQQLEQAFENIAEVDFALTFEHTILDEKELYLYWRYFVSQLDELLPSHLTRLEAAKIDNLAVYVYVISEEE